MTDSEDVLLTTDGDFKHKVSSILNGSSDYASKHMFDNSLHSCWNSDQGTTQFVVFDFLKPVTFKTIRIMFQGGFVGGHCKVETGTTTSTLVEVHQLQGIEDANHTQEFTLPPSETPSRYLRLTFSEFSDFYGRMIIYNLEVRGSR